MEPLVLVWGASRTARPNDEAETLDCSWVASSVEAHLGRADLVQPRVKLKHPSRILFGRPLLALTATAVRGGRTRIQHDDLVIARELARAGALAEVRGPVRAGALFHRQAAPGSRVLDRATAYSHVTRGRPLALAWRQPNRESCNVQLVGIWLHARGRCGVQVQIALSLVRTGVEIDRKGLRGVARLALRKVEVRDAYPAVNRVHCFWDEQQQQQAGPHRSEPSVRARPRSIARTDPALDARGVRPVNAKFLHVYCT
eukprot:COSAG02_NODE_446_length_22141_cov_17.963842_5_plen_257_part_00